MNNGILQATIAYKQTYDGKPLDINGRLTSETGRLQAIAILEGTANPNPLLYEVETYFVEGGFIHGTPTAKVDYDACPVSNFTIDKDFVILTLADDSEVLNIFSTYGWDLVGDNGYVSVSPITGATGVSSTTLLGVAYGDVYLTFKEKVTGETRTVYVVYVEAVEWILTDGTWNNLGFWQPDGIWNY